VEKEEDTYYVPGISDRWMSKYIHKKASPHTELDMPVLGLVTPVTTLKEREIPVMEEPKAVFNQTLTNQEPTNQPPIEIKETPIVEAPIEVINVVEDAAELNPKSPRSKPAAQIAKEQKQTRYQQQEAKRAPKVQIDQTVVLWIWVVGILVAFVASAIVSFNGITAVAEFVGLSAPWMGGLFFFFIELMYLLFLMAYLILTSRLDEEGKKEKTLGAIIGMFAFGAVAVLANGFHTIDFWEYNLLEPRMWAGLVLSMAAPLAIISASKMASRVVFAKAVSV
jgi:hypothetical protein